MKDDSRNKLGSKREIRPGVWEIAVASGRRRDGSMRRKYRTIHGTEQDADAEIIRLAADMGRSPTIGDGMTMDDYFWGVFLPDREATTTNATSKTYERHYRNHIAAHFGQRDIGSITYTDVRRWVDELPPQSAPQYTRTMRAILNQAHYDGIIPESPMEGRRFRMPRGRDTTPQPVWGPSEVMDALSRPTFHDAQLFGLWAAMVGAGLSRSEALGLDWEDFTWSEVTGMDGKEHWAASVPIRRAVTTEDGVKEPKNSRRYRSVPIPPLFADALHEHAGTGPICQSERYAKDGNRPTGNRLDPHRIPQKWKSYFAPGKCLDGLPFVHLNRMRATYATIMQGAGVDSTIINSMQGRSSNSQVLYSNYLNPGSDTYFDAASAFQRRVMGS